MMSQRPRDIGPKCQVQPKQFKAKENTDRRSKRKVRWASISTTEGMPSMPHHIEGGETVGSPPGDVMPDKQSGRSCTGSDITLFESVDSDNEGTSSDGAFDDACKQENSKFGRTKILLVSKVF